MSYQPISAGTRFRILMRDGFACAYCGARSPEARLHVDHVVARANGGDNDDINLVTACEACNLGKRIIDLPDNWRMMREYAIAGMCCERMIERFGDRASSKGLWDIIQVATDERVGRRVLGVTGRAQTFDDAVAGALAMLDEARG